MPHHHTPEAASTIQKAPSSPGLLFPFEILTSTSIIFLVPSFLCELVAACVLYGPQQLPLLLTVRTG